MSKYSLAAVGILSAPACCVFRRNLLVCVSVSCHAVAGKLRVRWVTSPPATSLSPRSLRSAPACPLVLLQLLFFTYLVAWLSCRVRAWLAPVTPVYCCGVSSWLRACPPCVTGCTARWLYGVLLIVPLLTAVACCVVDQGRGVLGLVKCLKDEDMHVRHFGALGLVNLTNRPTFHPPAVDVEAIEALAVVADRPDVLPKR